MPNDPSDHRQKRPGIWFPMGVSLTHRPTIDGEFSLNTFQFCVGVG